MSAICVALLLWLPGLIAVKSKSAAETSDFAEIVKRTAFVDKTLLIKQLFQHKFVIVTAPQTFGKSTNLNMIKRFLEIPLDAEGQQLTNIEDALVDEPIEKPADQLTENFKLFKENRLYIYRDKQFFYENCGKYPVVYIDFKLSYRIVKDVHDPFRIIVHRTFREHTYLTKTVDGERVWVEQWLELFSIDTFLKYWHEERYKTLSEQEVHEGFLFLLEVVHIYFTKAPILLIDNYEAIVVHELLNFNSDVGKTVHSVTSSVSQLLGSGHVDKCLINCRDQGLATLLAQMRSNMTHFNFLGEHSFSEFYGFTENEVEELMERFEIEHELHFVKNCYGGYRVNGKNVTVYHSGSVVSFLRQGMLKSYWTEPGIVQRVKASFLGEETCAKISKLLKGETITVEKQRRSGIEHILFVRKLKNEALSYDQIREREALFFEILSDEGYFNIIENVNNATDTTLTLQIPNKEIKPEFQTMFTDFCKKS